MTDDGSGPADPGAASAPKTRPRFDRLITLLLIPLPIFLVALGLRLWGIGWGLPNETRFWSYHPDESQVLVASLRTHPLLLLLDPGFYNYGSLALLTNSFFIHLGEALGWVRTGAVPLIPSASQLLTARLVTAALGALSSVFIFHTGRLLYGRTAGVFAGLFYTVAPLAVQHGHFATVDVPAAFWIAGSLYFAVRHVNADDAGRHDIFWSGLFAGLAAATKYNAVLILIAGFVAWILAGKGRRFANGPVTLGLSAAIGFVAGCPAILLNPVGLLTDVAFEAQHVQAGHGLVFAHTAPGWLYHLGFTLPWGLSWPLLILALFGVLLAVWRHRPGDLVLLAFLIPYVLLIGLADVKFARYTLPLFPPLVLLAAGALTAGFDSRFFRMASGIVGTATVVFALALSIGFNQVMVRPDPRDQAATYLWQSGVSPIGFATGPWFYHPPLAPGISDFRPPAAKAAATEATNPKLIPADGEWNVAQLKKTRPAAVVLSELNEYADAVRAENEPALEYLQTLEKQYTNRRVFTQPVQVFGYLFVNPQSAGGLPIQPLPHDMLYTNPTVVVFLR